MSTQLVRESAAERSRRSLKAYAVSALGPLTVLAGLVWAVAQPYRITLLDPRGESFWWLLVEPPLLVVLAGLVFHLLIAPGVVADLEEAEDGE